MPIDIPWQISVEMTVQTFVLFDAGLHVSPIADFGHISSLVGDYEWPGLFVLSLAQMGRQHSIIILLRANDFANILTSCWASPVSCQVSLASDRENLITDIPRGDPDLQ
jgi:hypothetical protein